MPVRAQSADGKIHEFPDGTDRSVIDRVMKSYAATSMAKSKPKSKDVPWLPSTGALANFNRGLGIGDEIAAGLATLGDVVTGKVQNGKTLDFAKNVGGAFNRNMAAQRSTEDTYAKSNPVTANLAKGVGMAATAAVPAGKTANVFSTAPRLMNAARGAVAAGTQAGLYALADRGTFGERVRNASRAVRDPITLGLGAAAGALGPARSGAPKAPAKAAARSRDELQAAKQAAYDAVDQAGIKYKPEAVDQLVGDINKAVTDAKINAARHPAAASMVADIEALRGSSPTLTELDQLRQVVNRDVTGSSDRAEKFFGRKIVDQIDNFIEKSGPDLVVSGAGEDAGALITNARKLNAKLRKVEAVEGAVEKARLRAGSTGSGGNIDNATRQNLRGVMEKTPGLTPEERQALETVVLGGKGQNALRLVGKLSPSGNGLMAALNLGSAAAAGPLGAVPGALGIASKYAADAMTQKNVQEVLRVISSDAATVGQLTAAQRQLASIPNTPAASALRRMVAARLARVAGVSGGARASTATPNALAAASNVNP